MVQDSAKMDLLFIWFSLPRKGQLPFAAGYLLDAPGEQALHIQGDHPPKMIRAAYTRLWKFRTRARIALTSDIRQHRGDRRS